MGFNKKLKNRSLENQERAIQAHAGFVNFVIGRVNKVGIGKVLQQCGTVAGVTEYYWLKKAYEKVLDFAADVQVKRIVGKPQDADEDQPMKLPIVRLYATNTVDLN